MNADFVARIHEVRNVPGAWLLFSTREHVRIMGEYQKGTPLPVKGDVIEDGLTDLKEKIYYEVDSVTLYPGGTAFVAEVVPLPPAAEGDDDGA